MKKLLALISALFIATLSFAACAEATATLEGLITEIDDGYFLMNDVQQGIVRINLDETTVYEGTATRTSLVRGQYVYVQYNGVMTRSLPPQVSAQKVSCFQVSGTVSALLENGFIVDGDSTLKQVVVHAGSDQPPVFKGMAVTLYYNGIMALSQPPQINAVHMVVPTLSGSASNVTDKGFTLTSADGTQYAVTLTSETVVSALPAD
ncbi:MAG TPA: hypothetical protein PLR69_08900, partial [Candidatus Limiplasma sp.]|nr:hypothetical protein [Candidatus Limiplasma sp.]